MVKPCAAAHSVEGSTPTNACTDVMQSRSVSEGSAHLCRFGRPWWQQGSVTNGWSEYQYSIQDTPLFFPNMVWDGNLQY